jgi:hypothetical protein
MLEEDERRERLAGLGLPLVEIGLDPLGIDVDGVLAIAADLGAQLEDEVRA